MEVTHRKSKKTPPNKENSLLVHGFNSRFPTSTLADREKTLTTNRSLDLSDVKSSLESSNHTYFNNKGTTLPFRSKGQQKSASERLEIKHQTKEKLMLLLKKIGEVELSDRVKICGSKFSTLTCGRHVISRKPFNNCEFRLCPHCASRRSKKIARKYLPMMTEFLKTGRFTPCHLVLTQAHRKGETVAASRKRLMKSFGNLVKRKFFEQHFAGGVYAFEATISESVDVAGCWHSHLHLLVFRRRFFDISHLRSEWKKVTGDSHVLRLDPVKDIQSGLREILKYVSKPLDIAKFKPRHLREFLLMKGAKMFGAFGQFSVFCRKFEPSDNQEPAEGEEVYSGYTEGDCCPFCDEPLFEMVLTVEELIGFMRRLEAVPRVSSG
jgi:hypothetical protein